MIATGGGTQGLIGLKDMCFSAPVDGMRRMSPGEGGLSKMTREAWLCQVCKRLTKGLFTLPFSNEGIDFEELTHLALLVSKDGPDDDGNFG